MTSKLIWNVLIENINKKQIEQYNIFEHRSFVNELRAALKATSNREVFFEDVKRIIRYYFWAKCEWEIVVSDWPPSSKIDKNTAVNTIKKAVSQNHQYNLERALEDYKQSITSLKIDVYYQVMLNWDAFCSYLWQNQSLLLDYTGNTNKERLCKILTEKIYPRVDADPTLALIDYFDDNNCLVAPCKIGDIFYSRKPYTDNVEFRTGKVSMLQQKADKSWKIRISFDDGVSYDLTEDMFKTTCYKTLEEAENASKIESEN